MGSAGRRFRLHGRRLQHGFTGQQRRQERPLGAEYGYGGTGARLVEIELAAGRFDFVTNLSIPTCDEGASSGCLTTLKLSRVRPISKIETAGRQSY